MRAPEVAVGAIVRDGDRVLLVRRGRAPAVGKWSVPGGRVRFGESLREAVAREVREETGLDVEVGAFAGWVERRGGDPEPHHFVILDFFAVPTGDPAGIRAGDDAADVRWVRAGELGTVALVEGLAEFLAGIGIPGEATG
jgi:ADP-ribose pyrophosphatase YjhB (NUDIX family)